MKKRSLASLLILSAISYGSVAQTSPDDCSRMMTESQLQAYKLERIADSIRLSIVQRQVKVATTRNATPSGLVNDMQIIATDKGVKGFFSPIANADQYLVVASYSTDLNANPLTGVRYNAGDHLGNGIVLSSSDATAFIADDKDFTGDYNLFVFAGNTNSADGIVYTTQPVYKTLVTAKTTANNYYFGNLHSHSSYSDGNKDNTNLLPADDYAYAKNSLCMDFLGIAEHNHFSATSNPGMHRADYQPGLNAATNFTAANAGFLALYGMEWGVISNGGHLVIYGMDSLAGWETLSGSPNYDIFVGKYDYTGTNGIFDVVNRFAAKKAFASFAHPDVADYNNLKNINYDSEADKAVIGCAIESGPAFSTNTNYGDDPTSMGYLSYYNAMLAKGYHLGPSIDQDTHYLTFGRNTKARLVVVAPSIGKSDFYDAMRAMHFYATEMCDTKVDFTISGQMMGSIFTHAGAPAITVSASNATYPGTPTIKLLSGVPGNNVTPVVIASSTAATMSYTDNTLADQATKYYYLDITINGKHTMTSPIWYTRNDAFQAVANVAPNQMTNALVINGNPVQDNSLHIDLYTTQSQRVDIAIRDMAGRIIITQPISTSSGVNHADVNVSTLPSGTYMVTAYFAGQAVSRLVVK